MDISILLTTYNREDDCKKCLTKLLDQTVENLNVEILLLDDWHFENGNLKEFCTFKGIKYIHTGSQKEGQVHWRVPGYAYNIGAKLAKGNYFIIGGAEMYHLTNNCILQMYYTDTASAPLIYDEPHAKCDRPHTEFEILNNKLPFCFGLPKKTYFELGGYDEDLTGYCFDDNDFSDRVLKILPFVEVDAETVHLWNPRGSANRGDRRINKQTWLQNKQIYEERKNILVRNSGKNWGQLC